MRSPLPAATLLLALSAILTSCAISQPGSPASAPSSAVTETPDTVTPDVVDEPPPTANTGATLSVAPERLLPDGVLEVGDANAPVSLLVFTNHACDYCRRFHKDILPRLLADEVASGRVRIATVAFPLRKYPESLSAAAAVLCAAKQGKGQAMQDALFARGGANVNGALSNPAFEMSALQACVAAEDTRTALTHQHAWARSLGVSLIPTIFVNGEKITGLPEYGEVRGKIENTLEQ